MSTFTPDPEDYTVRLPRNPRDEKWRKFEEELNEIVLNQERAVRALTRKVMVIESGLQDATRPVGPLFFLGPPGSGKTFLAQTAARLWLGEPDDADEVGPLVKISGENYQDSHEGSTLKGSPPGYVGYEDESPLENIGQFDRKKRLGPVFKAVNEWVQSTVEDYPELQIDPKLAIAMNEYLLEHQKTVEREVSPLRGVLLVDEFEKMHFTIQKQFLGILDDGFLELHNGRTVDFRGCLIIFTSNIATEKIADILSGNKMGFHAKDEVEDTDQEIYETAREEVKRILDPALYSRIGHEGIIVFHQLSRDEHRKIVYAEFEKLQQMVATSPAGVLTLRISDKVVDFILSRADAETEGARQIGRLVEKYLLQLLIRQISAGNLRSGDQLLFDMEGGKVVLRRTKRPGGKKLPPYVLEQSISHDQCAQEKVNEIDEFFRNNIQPTLDQRRLEKAQEEGASDKGDSERSDEDDNEGQETPDEGGDESEPDSDNSGNSENS